MHCLIYGLYSGVAGYPRFIFVGIESICSKALTLRNLVDFQVVHVVHPFVHLAIKCELMWYDLLFHEALSVVLDSTHDLCYSLVNISFRSVLLFTILVDLINEFCI